MSSGNQGILDCWLRCDDRCRGELCVNEVCNEGSRKFIKCVRECMQQNCPGEADE